MKLYRIKAKLLAPLALRKNRQSGGAPQSLDYLPGGSLRGAVAAKYLRMGGDPQDSAFRTLFLDHPVAFPNLLPSDETGDALPRVLPLTSVSCKRHPGFKSIPKERHGVRDALASKLVVKNFPALKSELLCPFEKCGNTMKAFAGFWNGKLDRPRRFQPSMLFQRHTGIDRVTGTIAVQIFFISQAMDDWRKNHATGDYHQQHLSGELFLEPKQWDALKAIVPGHLFVGAERTRGMGEIEISIDEASPAAGFNLRDWNSAFKDRIHDRLNHAQIDASQSDQWLNGLFFSIKLESDALLTDRFLRPTSELPLSQPNVNQVMKVTQARTARGWNNAWGLSKPDDLAVAMGSVYLYQYTGDDVDSLINDLQKLQLRGVGLRREEGFGRVAICDPLHLTKEVI